jgi:Flp pilus assembly protein TadD
VIDTVAEAAAFDVGIKHLMRVVEAEPLHWPAMWALGRALTSLRRLVESNHVFCCAFQVNPNDLNVGRELGLSSLRLGNSEIGKIVLQEICNRFPSDHSLVANLALAKWMVGELEEALNAVDRSLEIKNDEITLALKQKIEMSVKYGHAPPRSLD